ncbi:uncharacterized protein HD556DRAFT_1311439 [Suillus plorans]|uniref:Uncharacterized protein n=1 Tax=Suillus plorans TaxID=116603 RepID=A0A9P7AIT3_9AGAM|nr:uncharacterized protein HD556DRAFT_1311439 [Suillus plorans]KAG1789258.1 hypothetical protein HD556DRAFT_1311439 [Suillus plorans]
MSTVSKPFLDISKNKQVFKRDAEKIAGSMSSHSLANRLSTSFKYQGSNGGTMKIEFILDSESFPFTPAPNVLVVHVDECFASEALKFEKVRSSACFLKVFLSTYTGRASLYVHTNFNYIRPYLHLPNNYDKAIDLYSTVIDLNSTFNTLANRSKAKLGEMLWEDALLDMQKCCMARNATMKPSKPSQSCCRSWMMLLKLRYEYVCPSEAFEEQFGLNSTILPSSAQHLYGPFVRPSSIAEPLQNKSRVQGVFVIHNEPLGSPNGTHQGSGGDQDHTLSPRSVANSTTRVSGMVHSWASTQTLLRWAGWMVRRAQSSRVQDGEKMHFEPGDWGDGSFDGSESALLKTLLGDARAAY